MGEGATIRLRAPALSAALGLALGGCFTGPAPDATDPTTTSPSPTGAAIQLSPAALSFDATGRIDPPAQIVTVSNAGAGTLAMPVTTTSYLGQEQSWLSVTVSGTAAPYTITVQPIVAALPQRPSPNVATISVDCPGASNGPLPVAVQLTVR